MVNEKFSVGTQLLPPNDDEAEIQVSLFPFRPFFRKMDGVPKSPRIIMSLMNQSRDSRPRYYKPRRL